MNRRLENGRLSLGEITLTRRVNQPRASLTHRVSILNIVVHNASTGNLPCPITTPE